MNEMTRDQLHKHMRRHHNLPPEFRSHEVDDSYRGYLATLTNWEMTVAHAIAHGVDLIGNSETHWHPVEPL